MATDTEMWSMRPTLSGELSRRMVVAAVAEAAAMSVRATVVTAAIGMPPDEFYAAIESDAAAVASFAARPGLALIAGGIPVVTDGQVAGAIGVAGAMTGAEDRRIAEAAVGRACG